VAAATSKLVVFLATFCGGINLVPIISGAEAIEFGSLYSLIDPTTPLKDCEAGITNYV